MTFKNLSKALELAGDLLRQRRDFYAISLGLILFHLAGGVMKDTATLSTLPVKLAHPEVLYWSTWVSFAYFAWRYWVLDPGSLRRFKEEWTLQARASTEFRLLCQRWIERYGLSHDIKMSMANPLARSRPPFPEIKENGVVNFNEMRNLESDNFVYPNGTLMAPIKTEDLTFLRRAKVKGFFRALILERTASDLLLPYGMGAAAILISIVTASTGHSLRGTRSPAPDHVSQVACARG